MIGEATAGNGSNTITIGNTSATKLYVGKSSIASGNTADAVCFSTTTGQLTYNATDCTSSLRKYKRDIKPLNGALAEAMLLNGLFSQRGKGAIKSQSVEAAS